MKNIITLITCCITIITYAQNFQGKATYKTFRKVDLKKGSTPSNSAMQEIIQEQLKKQYQQVYTLNFNKTASTYTQNKKLSTPQSNIAGVKMMIIGDGGGTDVIYKNIATRQYINKTEISGKRFLIKDTLEKFDWELSGETKNIGNYTCYKAIRTREEERVSFSMTDGEQKESKQKVIVETVAWYTPQIPISNGPEGFWGLPGLILEIQDGNQTIVCSEIVLNTSGKIQIKKPSKGKTVTQEKFDKIMDAHSKEMMERFKSNRKDNEGSSFSIELQR